jgi:hypothetical protein
MGEETEDLGEWQELLAAFKAIPRQHRVAAIELIRDVGVLGPNAIEILRAQGAGMVRGLPYGDWNGGQNMVDEAIAEARDGANYMQREWIRLQKVIEAHRLFVAAHDTLLSAESK